MQLKIIRATFERWFIAERWPPVENRAKTDYQALLKRVAALYLMRTPHACEQAVRAIESCPRTDPFTIGDIIWGPIISSLKDPDIYENDAALSQIQAILSGTSQVVKRAYVKYDFRPSWGAFENGWYEKLVETWHFLQGFPFNDVRQAIAEFEGSKEALQTFSADMPILPLHREKILRFVLREVSETLLSIDLQMSQIKAGYISPAVPFTVIRNYDQSAKDGFPPDVSHSLVWAERALGSISGQQWLIVTWQLRGKSLILSLR